MNGHYDDKNRLRIGKETPLVLQFILRCIIKINGIKDKDWSFAITVSVL